MSSDKGKIRKLVFVILLILLIILLIVGFILISEYNHKNTDNSHKVEEIHQVAYDHYTYELPVNCEYRPNYMEDGVKKLNIFDKDALWSATITVIKASVVESIKDGIFNDPTIIGDALEEQGEKIEEGQISYYGSIPIVSFHLYYENMKYLLAYIPAYDNNLYCIRLSSSTFVNDKEEMFFDYETLNSVIDILNTAQKVK